MADLSAVRARLESGYEQMSPQQRRAARYMLNMPAEIALYPLRQVAQQAGVGVTTLVRLAQSLGFDSYKALRELFREGMRAGADGYYATRAESFLTARSGRRFEMMYRNTAETLTRAVQDAFAAVPAGNLAAAAQAMKRAKRIYVLGLRSNYSAAFYFHYVMRTFSTNVILLEDRMDMLIDELGEIGPHDALLVISYEPYARSAVKAVEHAVTSGAAVIAITDNNLSPVARGAAHAFFVPTASASFYQSLLPTMAIVEAFVCYLFAQSGPAAVRAVKKEFERREKFGIYWRERG